MAVIQLFFKMSKGIFHQFLLEGYEKSEKKNLDFVRDKKIQFWNALNKANDALGKKNYTLANELFYNIVTLINNDPYPDELNLEIEVIYCIKCCYCYSYIEDFENNSSEHHSSDNVERILASLRCSYSDKILPYYLQLRLDLLKHK